MSATSNLGLPYIDAGQAQKHVTHNEALRSLDTLVQLAVQDRDLLAPPGSPVEGQRWIVKATASGVWAGHDNQIAAWQDGAWQFSAPVAGWLAYVIDEEILVAWGGESWSAVSAASGVTGEGGDITELQNMSLLGIGTSADETNPLSATLNNVLWAAKRVADGGDGSIRYKLSKEDSAKSASLLFQENFSGRAEIGLTGDDDFHFKVSADGSAWLESIKIDCVTGRVSFPSGGARELLLANRNYYVRTDGSDSNSGSANDSGHAFLTIGKAMAVVGALDPSIYNVTVNVGAGTFSENVTLPLMSGPGVFSLVGAGTASTTIQRIVSTHHSAWRIGGLKLASTSGDNLEAGPYSQIAVTSAIEFGVSTGRAHIFVRQSAQVTIQANYAISGGAAFHWRNDEGGALNAYGRTVTITNTPAFSSQFNYAVNGAKCIAGSMTFSGSATGQRFYVGSQGGIFTNGGGTSYFPGNLVGGTDTASGGVYV